MNSLKKFRKYLLSMSKALLFIGTRPELIKVAPLIQEMKAQGLRKQLIVVNTGQHKELMYNTLKFLGIRADFTLDLMVAGQSLNDLAGRALVQFQNLIATLELRNEKPALILAQGDTATAFAASMTAFHNKIPFAHVEAGLRTNDFENPFPEEYYRRVISLHAAKHFSPTYSATENLIKEGVSRNSISMTGNTIVDAIKYIQKLRIYKEDSNLPEFLRKYTGKLVLITCHRRENFGENVDKIITSVKDLARKHPDQLFVWVRHPNPSVKEAIERSGLQLEPNIHCIDPLDYFDMLQLYPHVKIILTDSGGIQEEAPSFKIPVIVLRETTERMESVNNGFAFLCGADPEKIKNAFENCVSSTVAITHNPYGDGKASKRIVSFLIEQLQLKSKKTNPKLTNARYAA
jgi:UDP-N-acetylglucosamine 2-epimerase (non-hydrolysing)